MFEYNNCQTVLLCLVAVSRWSSRRTTRDPGHICPLGCKPTSSSIARVPSECLMWFRATEPSQLPVVTVLAGAWSDQTQDIKWVRTPGTAAWSQRVRGSEGLMKGWGLQSTSSSGPECWLLGSWVGLVQVPTALSPWVQSLCHVQKKAFHSAPPHHQL